MNFIDKPGVELYKASTFLSALGAIAILLALSAISVWNGLNTFMIGLLVLATVSLLGLVVGFIGSFTIRPFPNLLALLGSIVLFGFAFFGSIGQFWCLLIAIVALSQIVLSSIRLRQIRSAVQVLGTE